MGESGFSKGELSYSILKSEGNIYLSFSLFVCFRLFLFACFLFHIVFLLYCYLYIIFILYY